MDRPYQSRTIEAIRRKCSEGVKRILVVAPTGSGKGYSAARVMEMCANKGNPNVFFAAQRELIFQIGKQLSRLEVPCNVVMAGVKNEYESADEHYAGGLCSLVAKDTLWSRAFRSKKMEIPPAKLIQIDECHMSLSQTYSTIMDFYSESICVGWTATPCRGDGKSLGKYYDTMIQSATYKELQDAGFLIPLRVFAPDRPDLKGLKVSRGDYAQTELEKRMNRDEMVGNIVREWTIRAEGRSTVAFLSGIQHSIHVRNEFRKLLGRNGDGTERVEHIDGKMENTQREDIMGRAADGRVLILCNYGVLHTGVDVPQWKYLICARPTKSFGLWRQLAGRIQRPYPGHDHACIARDSLVLTDKGEVPIQNVKRFHRIWDGVEFVSHGGVVCQGIRPVIEWDGLKATHDHKVLTNEGWKEISAANREQRRIVRSANNGNPVRLFDDSDPHGVRDWNDISGSGRSVEQAEVWDIINCGPRHRFTANGLIVANCIQDHSDNCLHFGYPDEDVEWSLEEDVVAEDLPRTERNKVEGQKKEPHRCEKCSTEYRGPHCPSCGHVPEQSGKDVKMGKGDLKELERKKCNRESSLMDKQKYWDTSLGIAIQRGLKVGAAAHIYKEKFGTFPNSKIEGVPRSSQWAMTARDFYARVIKPAREAAKEESQLQFSGILHEQP